MLGNADLRSPFPAQPKYSMANCSQYRHLVSNSVSFTRFRNTATNVVKQRPISGTIHREGEIVCKLLLFVEPDIVYIYIEARLLLTFFRLCYFFKSIKFHVNLEKYPGLPPDFKWSVPKKIHMLAYLVSLRHMRSKIQILTDASPIKEVKLFYNVFEARLTFYSLQSHAFLSCKSRKI